jgi:hypothetical protein
MEKLCLNEWYDLSYCIQIFTYQPCGAVLMQKYMHQVVSRIPRMFNV